MSLALCIMSWRGACVCATGCCSAGNVPGTFTTGRQQRRLHVCRRDVATTRCLQQDQSRRAPDQLSTASLSHRHLTLSAMSRAGSLPTPPRSVCLLLCLCLSVRPRCRHYDVSLISHSTSLPACRPQTFSLAYPTAFEPTL